MRGYRKHSFHLYAMVLVVLLCGAAIGQTITGSISGTVVDQSDAVVPRAKVTLSNELNGETRETVTSDAGEFVFTAMPSGTYTVSVEANGFQTFRRTGVFLTAVGRLPLGSIRLAMGDVTQTVVVAAQGEGVSTENADISGGVTTRQLDQLVP